LNKKTPVRFVVKNTLTPVAASHNMVESTRTFDPNSSRHPVDSDRQASSCQDLLTDPQFFPLVKSRHNTSARTFGNNASNNVGRTKLRLFVYGQIYLDGLKPSSVKEAPQQSGLSGRDEVIAM
jgi:hypothetical protein